MTIISLVERDLESLDSITLLTCNIFIVSLKFESGVGATVLEKTGRSNEICIGDVGLVISCGNRNLISIMRLTAE